MALINKVWSVEKWTGLIFRIWRIQNQNKDLISSKLNHNKIINTNLQGLHKISKKLHISQIYF
jgi:hypothetical protein